MGVEPVSVRIISGIVAAHWKLAQESKWGYNPPPPLNHLAIVSIPWKPAQERRLRNGVTTRLHLNQLVIVADRWKPAKKGT
ncbi:hypothetical protein HMPREF3213_03772 [Heyndrickxia coagulans]|uniref:Uncharacterized protein n=2 Tax=Heyndrickxia coagulans TaxID=1398 RepID=A0A133KAE9_HEYCO|nr:hypothetical protein HMPREF3213_03772 [Heyndrickxia coagulans]